MASQLTVDNIVGATTSDEIHIPGHVVQVLQDVRTTTYTQTAPGSLTYDTVQSVTITPISNTSKILLRVNYGFGDSSAAGSGLVTRFQRGTTTIADYNVFWASSNNGTGPHYDSASHEFLDSPATASAITYNFQVASQSGGDTIYYNSTFSNHSNMIATLTAMEIAQ